MFLRRVGGRVRWMPGDLLATPALVAGTWLLAGVDVVKNRVADGPWTVRVLVETPLHWFNGALGWAGLGLVAFGIVLTVLARRLGQPHRRLTGVRYLPYRVAAWALVLAALLSLWRLSDHVTDLGRGGAQWRFIAEPRTRWVNDVTTIVLAAAAVLVGALSFGRKRPVDDLAAGPVAAAPEDPTLVAESISDVAAPAPAGDADLDWRPPSGTWPAQAKRERVPTTTAAKASTSRTMPAGVATKSRSTGAAKRPDTGS